MNEEEKQITADELYRGILLREEEERLAREAADPSIAEQRKKNEAIARAVAMYHEGFRLWNEGEKEKALVCFSDSLELNTKYERLNSAAYSAISVSMVWISLHKNLDLAEKYLEEALALLEKDSIHGPKIKQARELLDQIRKIREGKREEKKEKKKRQRKKKIKAIQERRKEESQW